MGRTYFYTPGFCPGCSIRHHDHYVRKTGRKHPACEHRRSLNAIEMEGPVDAA